MNVELFNFFMLYFQKHDDESDDDEDTENQETYLQSIADAQERQRHKQAYEQLKAGGKITLVELF